MIIFIVGLVKEKFEVLLFKLDMFLVLIDDCNCKYDNWFIFDCLRIIFLVYNKVIMYVI